MADSTSVILSGFADEASNQKKAEQQFLRFCGHRFAALYAPIHRRRQRRQERDAAGQTRDQVDQ